MLEAATQSLSDSLTQYRKKRRQCGNAQHEGGNLAPSVSGGVRDQDSLSNETHDQRPREPEMTFANNKG
jgi:hypothetical protein